MAASALVGVLAVSAFVGRSELMREQLAVPRAEFRSYYGRPILKTPAWNWMIAAYLFSGGLSAGSAMLAAGADLTGRPGLRRVSRVGVAGEHPGELVLPRRGSGPAGAVPSHAAGGEAELADEHGHVAAVGVRAGRGCGRAGGADAVAVAGTLAGSAGGRLARPAGLWAAATAPGVASYTAVLLSQTAVPAWREAHPYLPFVFTGSAAASGGGLGMLLAPVGESGPARRMAVAGAGLEVAASRLMEQRLGSVRGGVHDG